MQVFEEQGKSRRLYSFRREDMARTLPEQRILAKQSEGSGRKYETNSVKQAHNLQATLKDMNYRS